MFVYSNITINIRSSTYPLIHLPRLYTYNSNLFQPRHKWAPTLYHIKVLFPGGHAPPHLSCYQIPLAIPIRLIKLSNLTFSPFPFSPPSPPRVSHFTYAPFLIPLFPYSLFLIPAHPPFPVIFLFLWFSLILDT